MIIIDGNRFVTTEGAQSFYLERRMVLRQEKVPVKLRFIY